MTDGEARDRPGIAVALAATGRVPRGRPRIPADGGHLVAFLASEAARNITGQAIGGTASK